MEGRLSYDAEVIREKKVISSAFDLITELPSVYSDDGNSITIIGGNGCRIVINGRPPTMSYENTLTYLKSIPAEKVINVEIAFSAPPQWFVGTGSAINVIIKREKDYTYSGRIGGSYRNYTVNGTTLVASAFLTSPKWNFESSYSGGYYVNMTRTINTIKHNVNGQINDINSESFTIVRNLNHNPYLSVTRYFNDSTGLVLYYNGNIFPNMKRKNKFESNYIENSKSEQLTDNSLHGISSVFYRNSSNGTSFNAGLGYTNYSSDREQKMQYGDSFETLADYFLSEEQQKVNRFTGYFNVTNKLSKGWILNYGIYLDYTKTQNEQFYTDLTTPNSLPSENGSTIKDNNFSGYVSIRKNFLDGNLSFSLTLEDEYSKNKYSKNEGYETNNLLPRLHISYSLSVDHMFIFENSTRRDHPSYWSMQDFVSRTNKYEQQIGNPSLRPSLINSTSLYYYFKQKYQIGVYYLYCTDNILRMMYQRPDTLLSVSQPINQQKTQALGLNVNIPIDIIKDRIAANVWYNMRAQQYKDDDWHGLSYDKRWVEHRITLSGDILISKKPQIIFTTSAWYHSRCFGGMIEQSDCWNLTLGLRSNLLNDRLYIGLRFADIFESEDCKTSMKMLGQYWESNSNFYHRMIFLQVFYKFKGYRNINQRGVDSSRMGI